MKPTVAMWAALVLGAVLCAVPLAGRAAEKEAATDPVKTHLEFLGYQVDQVEQGLRARHPLKVHIVVSYARGGIVVQTGFPGKIGADSEGPRFAAVHKLNQQAWAARFFWSGDGHLLVDAWMPGLYDKARFAALLEAWEHDIQVLREAYPELKAFLKDS
jgi:hypothetical protein